jgi:cysteine desulfurase
MKIIDFIKNRLKKERRVFLDFASATPVRREVLDFINNNSSTFYNPSGLYLESRKAKEMLEEAKSISGNFLNTSKDNIVFTSSGTESNNLAILGVYKKAVSSGIKKPHIITSKIEHPSVLEVCKYLETIGASVTFLDPEKDGTINPEKIYKEITEDTILVSLMYVNNEIGTVNKIKEIGNLIRKYKDEKGSSYPYFHSDLSQAPLYYPLDVSTLKLDLATLDGIKIYGPRSVGILFVSNKVSIEPVFFGGGQQGNIRSGTESPVNAMAMAIALDLAKKERRENVENVSKLRDYFLSKILEAFPESFVNGSLSNRSPNNINICMKVSGKYLDAEYLVVALDTYGVCLSYSSSCRTLKEDSSSYVVESLGDKECAKSSLRFTLGRETKKDDLDYALFALKKAVKQVLL